MSAHSLETRGVYDAAVRDFARFLLDVGYGVDFSYGDRRPNRDVLEKMVELAASDELFVGPDVSPSEAEEVAYFVLSSELGDWRDSASNPDPATEALVASVTALNGSTGLDLEQLVGLAVDRVARRTQLTEDEKALIHAQWEAELAKGWHMGPLHLSTPNASQVEFVCCPKCQAELADEPDEELDRGC